MKRTKIGSIENNIIYVEPNYIYSTEEYGVNGLNTYEFAPPLEDYSIFVNQLDFNTMRTSFDDMGLSLDNYWDSENKKWNIR